jgi:hypothetical protein
MFENICAKSECAHEQDFAHIYEHIHVNTNIHMRRRVSVSIFNVFMYLCIYTFTHA